ncbi:OmpA family protein [Allosphingosinicella humi]
MRGSQWSISFADLALLLLGCFVILFASRPAAHAVAPVQNATPVASALLDAASASLFEPGEARLTASGRLALEAVGRKALAGKRTIRIESRGRDAATHRFDGWELAAARAAAAARAVAGGGLSDSRIEIVVPPPRKGEAPEHRLVLRYSG